MNLTQLSQYSTTMLANSRAKMSRFYSGVSEMVANECYTDLIVTNMDISRLMVHDQLIQEEKLKLERQRGIRLRW